MSRTRTCPSCGAVLSRYNKSRLCGPCFGIARDAEIFDGGANAARAVIEVYIKPCNYDTAHDYLGALTKVLNALCRVHRVPFPTDIAAAFESTEGSAYRETNGVPTRHGLNISEGPESNQQSRVGKYAGDCSDDGSSDLSEVAS